MRAVLVLYLNQFIGFTKGTVFISNVSSTNNLQYWLQQNRCQVWKTEIRCINRDLPRVCGRLLFHTAYRRRDCGLLLGQIQNHFYSIHCLCDWHVPYGQVDAFSITIATRKRPVKTEQTWPLFSSYIIEINQNQAISALDFSGGETPDVGDTVNLALCMTALVTVACGTGGIKVSKHSWYNWVVSTSVPDWTFILLILLDRVSKFQL